MDTRTNGETHDKAIMGRLFEIIPNNELARRLGVTPQAVSKWSRIPDGRVLDVASATEWRMTPHELRGDLYPNRDDALPAHMRVTSEAGEVVAPEDVIPIAEASGWLKTPHEIRPDLYPNPDDGIPPDIRATMDAVVVGWREPADSIGMD